MKKIVLWSIALAALMAGCTPKSAGKLVIYSPNSEDLINKLGGAFEKETGIKIDFVSAGTGEIFKRLEAEKNSPNADVLWGGSRAEYLKHTDLFEQYVSPNDKDVLAAYQNVSGKVTSYCLDGSVLLVNANQIGDIAITGYASLLNPALKGRIAMGDPSNSSSAFAHLTNMLLAMGGDYTSEKGWDFVKQLLGQVKILNSSSTVHKGAADGEYAVSVTYEDPSAAYLRDGAPVKIVYMSEGVVYTAPGAAIVKGAKNLESAKKFIDFITSKAGQDVIGTQLTVRPVRLDAELGSYMTPLSDFTILTEDDEYIQANKSKIVEQYKAVFTQVQQ
jgi:iron(III) transport system substrate-binding protein